MYNYIFMICVILYPGYDLHCLHKEHIFLFSREKKMNKTLYKIIKTLYQYFSCQIICHIQERKLINHKIIEWCVEPP